MYVCVGPRTHVLTGWPPAAKDAVQHTRVEAGLKGGYSQMAADDIARGWVGAASDDCVIRGCGWGG